MALISKIRKNSWLLIIMIGLGLGGFLLMDATNSQGFLGSNQATMAEVAGEKIDINEFNNLEQAVYTNASGDPFARRNTLWNYYVEKILLEKEAAVMGLGVSKEELLDLQFGNNLSPVITRNFQNPATGQVDRNQILQFKTAIENNTLEPQYRAFWAYQENDIIRERLKEKMVNAISKGMYVPKWMAEMMANDQNSKVDFAYARVPFDAIQESEIALSDEDFEAYLKAHASEYEAKEPLRRVEYVVFPVLPSKEDSTDVYNQMVQLTEDFARTEDDSLFLQNNYGILDPTFYKKEELAANIADTVFQVLKETVIGPYFENGAYKSVKVLDRKMIPDSVRSRHILVRANMSSQAEVQQAFLTLDSLRVLINSGVQSFDSLAMQFGQDGTAAKGGDLGYVAAGQMSVKPFNDLIFYTAEPDSLYIIGTEVGVHLVEVTGRQFLTNAEGVRLGFISQEIIPSETTQNNIEQEALVLASEHHTLDELRAALAGRADLSFQNSGPLTRNAFSIPALGAGQSVRNIVRWAFGDDPSYDEPSVGELCKDVFSIQDPEKFYVSNFVIAGLKSVQKAGLPSLDAVKDDMEIAVVNQKKAELIKSKIAAGSALSAVASQFGVPVDTARNVSFSSAMITNLGAEPKVVATAFQLDVNATSGPIDGNSGVFVLTPIYKPAVSAAPNLQSTRSTAAMTLRSQVQSRLVEYLKEREGVEDNRSRFY